MKKFGLICTLLFFAKTGFSQKEINYSNTNKGQIFIIWGWNRAAYTKSNISFKGDDYDFKLKKVVAHDRPTAFAVSDYLRVDRVTIPQTNFKLGYFIRKNLAITVGFDHMKYVMDKDQTVNMKGVITREGSHKGSYDGAKKLTENFLTFEHTDGLNYINVEVEKYRNLYHATSNKFILDVLIGAGGGMLMPRTDITLLSYDRSDKFHISGFGLSLKAGLQATIFKRLVIKLENKNGYINMPDLILHKEGIAGRGKQTFFFTALDAMIGYSFSFNKKNKSK